MALSLPGTLLAQSNQTDVPRGEAAFVVQAPEREAAQAQPEAQQVPDNSSKVYFPDAITPESVAQARARNAEQQQIAAREAAEQDGDLQQVSTSEEGARDVAQLSDGSSTGALAQLTEEERQVLLDAVEGTDICDRATEIPAIQELCSQRLETRSAEFAPSRGQSAEDSLLGGRLDADRVATLESAIARLARNVAEPGDFSSQVIASVALNNQGATDNQAAEGDPTDELSPESQAVVNAIVQQLGGN